MLTRRLLLSALLAPALLLPETAPARPKWVKEGIVMAGNWEPLTFIRRRGGQTIADIEDWPLERTEAAARKLKEAGVNLVITNFHKGFGLKAEAADIEATRRFVEYAHRYGIRVGGYIGASMMYETFFAEEPAAAGWKQVDERGEPVHYSSSQAFRYMACRNNPGYHKFLEKLMTIAVRDLKLDLIHFDQMESWTEPNVCRCRYCIAQFREFLEAKYSRAQRVPRFGLERFDAVLPPAFAAFIAEGKADLVNPLMQDWVEFRAARYAQHYAEYEAFLHRMNPQVALEGNPNLDFSLNKGTRNAVDLGRLLQHGDIVWSEEPQNASWTPDGRLVSKIRSYKIARLMGKSLFAYTGGRYGTAAEQSPPHLRLAEAMAYNDMNLGMVGDVRPDGVTITPQARHYIDFFNQRKASLAGARVVADVAVLHSWTSIEFNPAATLPPVLLFEQSLIQERIPFDIVLDRHLTDLSKYKVLVLAGQDSLSDEQLQQVRHFVAQGGGVVATGDLALYNEWRIKRRAAGLSDLYGKGRVVHIETVIPAMTPPEAKLNYRFDSRYWKLPRNHDALIAAVRQAAGTEFAVRVTAPPSVTMELARHASTGALLLHLVNFDVRHAVSDIDVSLRLPAGVAGASITVESPDRPEDASVTGVVSDGRLHFRVPSLAVYDLVVIRPR